MRQPAKTPGCSSSRHMRRQPQQNACIELCNRARRNKWLRQYLFRKIKMVKDTATEWLWAYDYQRLKVSLGGPHMLKN
jgi:putative transposase